MQVDIYIKGVLSVIAVALVVIAWQGNRSRTASVWVENENACGSRMAEPCYVQNIK